MTRRVFACRTELPELVDRARPAPPRSSRGLLPALCSTLVLVPLAGVADGRAGWLSGALGGLCVLAYYRARHGQAGWGWLLLGVSLLALFVPRQPLPSIGPA